ncbi:MAG TPA: class I SAM-dependent methyltransferase [Casimicrobiaceae bacterium]|nr:class I SAM-dependent methyltransferase [Casimicrobiaceae bacterium]
MREAPARNDTLPAVPDETRLLADQVAYYRARATEYDAWWFRTGRFDRGPDNNAAWHADVAVVERAVDTMLAQARPRSVLELACGTGLFTRRLAPHAESVTAVDASPEVLAINQSRVAAPNVRYVEADLFAWHPQALYDCVFMSFWLSHVPRARFAAFWAMVRDALAPGGFAYVVDSAHDPTSTAANHPTPDREAGIVTRKLDDGREFRIVKVFYKPATLVARLRSVGFDAGIGQTARYFIYGEARAAG